MLIKWASKYQNVKQFEENYMQALKLFSMDNFAKEKVYTLSGGEKKNRISTNISNETRYYPVG